MKIFLTFCFMFMAGWFLPLLRAESIELKTGEKLVGELVEYSEEKIKFKQGEVTRVIAFKDMAPATVYQLKSQRITATDPAQHIALAGYCIDNSLFDQARAELRKVLELDTKMEPQVKVKQQELAAKNAEFIFNKAVRLLDDKKYENALDEFQRLLENYPDSPFSAQAKTKMRDAAVAVQKENQEKAKQLRDLEEKKQQDQIAKLEDNIRQKFGQANGLVDEAVDLNIDALQFETDTQTSKADKAWQDAIAKLAEAKKIYQELIFTTDNPEYVNIFSGKIEKTDTLLARAYSSIANLWLADGNFTESLRWVNKALAIEPGDDFSLKLKFKITELKLQKIVKVAPQSPIIIQQPR